MSALIDLTGQRFIRLVVIIRATPDKSRKIRWWCICDCGNVTIVQSNNLKSGNTKSCGCLMRERAVETNTTHGMVDSLEYHSWAGMIQRCTNPNNTAYKNYGSRGISVCKKWMKFENFFADMGERPQTLTLERINNDLGYFPENCCWDTRIAQARNRRKRSKKLV